MCLEAIVEVEQRSKGCQVNGSVGGDGSQFEEKMVGDLPLERRAVGQNRTEEPVGSWNTVELAIVSVHDTSGKEVQV